MIELAEREGVPTTLMVPEIEGVQAEAVTEAANDTGERGTWLNVEAGYLTNVVYGCLSDAAARYPADVMVGYPGDLSSGIPVWCNNGVPCRAL
ncbi:hypothetical protein LWI28_018844 [Acer negundo]|uniref:Uncharacterized protein n=1 Tax=Acer negundo TaxID=4023 RepID=A0AAD5I6Q6_ACENE|nr:hypothetical protein LWI28_018844 [Acer negundo]